MRFTLTLGPETVAAEIEERDGRYHVQLDGERVEVDARWSATGTLSLLIGGTAYLADVAEENGEIVVGLGGHAYRVRVEEPGRRLGRRRAGAAGDAAQRLVAPMPGRVVSVHVRAGDRVALDAPLVVLEAMKMENEFRATVAGVVAEVAVTAGQAVNAGDLLVVVSPERT